jgi:hypothetical protein
MASLHGNFLRIHLISPDFEMGELGFAIDRRKRANRGVRTMGNFV